MKILYSRNVVITPQIGQWLYFLDDTQEFDPMCTQTTDILTAELYNGKAAKDDNGQWIAAPGARKHELEYDILGFRVGLTLVRFDSDGKAVHDYTVITPTGVAFHGDGKANVLHTPSNLTDERVALEIISWICLGEDSGTEFPEDTTPEQWQWIRSDERDMSSCEIDEYIDRLDNPGNQEPPPEEPDEDYAATEARAKEYQERCIHANQTSLVWYLLGKEDHVCWDDVTNLAPDTSAMDGNQLAEYIDDELGEDWKVLIDIDDYIDDDEGQLGKSAAFANLNPLDLHSWDIELLRDYINENCTPREIFEWYLVDSWLASDLEALGHPTLTDGSNHWWGRRTTDQRIIHDGVLQEIAAKYI